MFVIFRLRCGGVSAARYAVIRALQQTVYRRERSVVEKRTRTDGQKIRIVRQAFHYIYRPPGIDSIPAGYRPISGMAIARLLGVDHSLVVRVLRNGESRKTKGEMGEGRKGVAVENKTVE